MLFILLVMHAVGGGYTFDSLPCSVKKGEITSDMCIYIYMYMHILCLFWALDCSLLNSFSSLVNEGREEDHYTVTVVHIFWPFKGKLILFFLLF